MCIAAGRIRTLFSTCSRCPLCTWVNMHRTGERSQNFKVNSVNFIRIKCRGDRERTGEGQRDSRGRERQRREWDKNFEERQRH